MAVSFIGGGNRSTRPYDHDRHMGALAVVIVWSLDLQLSMQSVPIITNVVSSNTNHGELYSIEHYVIKFVSDLREVGGFLLVLKYLQHLYILLYICVASLWNTSV
jgi:hypothetical protein